MKEKYPFSEIEPKWQQYWAEQRLFHVDTRDATEKYYCLMMFPYPSGTLHVGHGRNYIIGDAVTRYKTMRGKRVLSPMGWDAFGLPAENAAIKSGTHPRVSTLDNIATIKRQLAEWGCCYDWDREVTACLPDYYKWTQWLFLKLHEKGLAYKAKSNVNWCPSCATVLANEQVVEGQCERCDAVVVQKALEQWFFRITAYAERLLNDLDRLEGWPERVKLMQRNWIGRSEGAEIDLACEDQMIRVFTTRPDTLMGATFMAVAAEHPLARKAAESNSELAAFIRECSKGGVSEADIATQEKLGMDTGLKAIHPLTGAEIPVWIANYVLMGYGEGAIMAVPAHDERDFEFALKYGLPIRQVISLPEGQVYDDQHWHESYAAKDGTLVDSGGYTGLSCADGFAAIVGDLQKKSAGKARVQFRLRDWGISRQRYWGCPIPIIHCDDCGAVPVPEEDLPVVLPENLVPDGAGNPLKRCDAFLNVPCPKCGKPARRETDTMDTFVDSSWYFLRYTGPDNHQAMVDSRAADWMPVDQYIGGIEHAILHLLYARFWTKLMRDEGLINIDEPFKRLLTQGMVLAETYYREDAAGRRTWFNPADVEVQRDAKGGVASAVLLADGEAVIPGGVEKMAKSKNNGVDPQSLVDQYGADTVRLFSMFAAPPEQSLEWSEAGVEGGWRFLKRFWTGVQRHVVAGVPTRALDPEALDAAARDLRRVLHETIAKVGDDFGRRLTFNTAIAAIMECCNHLTRFEARSDNDRTLVQACWSALVRLIAPVTPHIAEALWRRLGHETSVFQAGWPAVDEAALVRQRVTVVIQVNGKVRGRIEVAPDAPQAEVESLARAEPNVARFLAEATVRKVIVVPNKLVNIVVGG